MEQVREKIDLSNKGREDWTSEEKATVSSWSISKCSHCSCPYLRVNYMGPTYLRYACNNCHNLTVLVGNE